MNGRGSCAWIVRDNAYVWARGRVVHVYGYGQPARRLTGEVTDARPRTSVYVTGFSDEEAFHHWCRDYDQRRRDEATQRNQALLRHGRPMLAPPHEGRPVPQSATATKAPRTGLFVKDVAYLSSARIERPRLQGVYEGGPLPAIESEDGATALFLRVP